MSDFTIMTTTTITPQRIADMMTAAIEGNYMVRSWCTGVYWKSKDTTPPDFGKDGPWYANAKTYDGEFEIAIHEADGDEADGGEKVHRLTRAEFEKGLALLAQKAPEHFADIVNDEEDGATADIMLQFIALGEERYC